MTSISMSSSRSVRFQSRGHTGPSLLAIVALFLLSIALGVAFAWSRTQLVHAAIRTAEMRREEQRLEMRERELQEEIAALKQPARIEKYAREKLGLVARMPAQVIRIDDEILKRHGMKSAAQ